MISTILVLLLSFLLHQLFLNRYQDQLRHDKRVFHGLFFYHLFFFLVYYTYASFNASDSRRYYYSSFDRSGTWFDFYAPGTPFLEFITYPLVQYLGFSYEAAMLTFSFLGYLGFLYFYLMLANTIEFRHKLFGVDFLVILLFLPNMHFWTVSLGKGSIMFFGLGLFFYGVTQYGRKWLPLLLGIFIIYHVRAHVMLVILLSLLAAMLFSSRGLKIWQKILIMSLALAALAPVADTFLSYLSIEETDSETVDNFIQHRGSELTKATSGVDITNYNQVEKLFSFWFRPLFIDAPNALGLFVSFENLLYLFLLFKLLSFSFLRYLIGSHWLVKLALGTFLLTSIALAQISGNMGIAIRQKSQIMYLVFFVLLAYADYAYRKNGKVVIGE